mmetsp:Transcript_121662/g.289223  ORF Transcript_121662/g.289223 Transcript_121662/m.289223 type:complete len:282 (+) Transcript_121662:542-1387(+)
MVHHDRFRVAGCAGSVDDAHSVSRPRCLLPGSQAIRALRRAKLQAVLERQDLADAAVFPGELSPRRHAPAHDGTQLRHFLDMFRSRLKLHLPIHHHDRCVGVVDLVLHLLRRIGGVDADVFAATKHGRESTQHPLRSIETKNRHTPKLLDAELYESFCKFASIFVVALPCPLRPCLPRQRGSFASSDECRHRFLSSQGRNLGEVLRGLLQKGRKQRRRGFLDRHNTDFGIRPLVLVIREDAKMLPRLVNRSLAARDGDGCQKVSRHNLHPFRHDGRWPKTC